MSDTPTPWVLGERSRVYALVVLVNPKRGRRCGGGRKLNVNQPFMDTER